MELAKKFGLSPEQFADNLKDNYQKHEVEQYPVEPVELAEEHIGAWVFPHHPYPIRSFIVSEKYSQRSVSAKYSQTLTYYVKPILYYDVAMWKESAN